MTFKELKHKIKEEQKDLAQLIRLGKPLRKPKNWEGASSDQQKAGNDLEWNQKDYRHRHIIYCQMFNNTPYELIEQPRDANKPSSYHLNDIKQIWEAELDEEVIHNCA